MIATLLLIAALQSDLGGLQTLTRVDDRACTGDGGWCVALVGGEQDGEPVVRPVLRRADDATAIAKPENSAVESFQPWTHLIRLSNGGALAGVQVRPAACIRAAAARRRSCGSIGWMRGATPRRRRSCPCQSRVR